jgi:hypothetical protein
MPGGAIQPFWLALTATSTPSSSTPIRIELTDADQRGERVRDAGRGLVVGQEHDAGVRVRGQHRRQVGGIHGLAPLRLQPDDVRAVGGRHAGEALAEVAAQRGHDLVTGRHQVGDRRLQAAAAGGGHHEEVVVGLENALGARGDVRQQLRELRSAVVDHRSTRRANHALGERCRAGDAELLLVDHGSLLVSVGCRW